ncbi:MAG: heme-binding protein [Polyangiaceae bacterium]|nr:heme-binding protein [Polyangiaceae bacterium]
MGFPEVRRATKRAASPKGAGISALITFSWTARLWDSVSCWFAEEPRYTVETVLKGVEIRRYAMAARVETHVAISDLVRAHDQGFRRLAAYFLGNNTTSSSGPERLPMAVPVLGAPSRLGGHRFTIIVPDGREVTALPTPLDARVRLREFGEQLVAVVGLRGSFRDDRARRDDLLTTLADLRLSIGGVPAFAAYGPPGATSLVHHNEVWVPIR